MATVVYLTIADGSPWTVPGDWNNANNKIEVIGGGGGGSSAVANGTTGAGGGGGAYSVITNQTLSGTVSFTVGTGGAIATNGGDSWFNGASLAAAVVGAHGGSGASGATRGLGGATSGSPGTPTAGGDGGIETSSLNGGSGGGGAAGPGGVGGAGGPSGGNSHGYSEDAGGGGGGNGGGGAGLVPPDVNTGGNGGAAIDSTAGGIGRGINTAGDNGSHGSGGGGGGCTPNASAAGKGGVGGNGLDLGDGTKGSGGGGGGGGGTFGGTGSGGDGGAGGLYGGGGGGGGWKNAATVGVGGVGGAGLIVITYTPAGGGALPWTDYTVQRDRPTYRPNYQTALSDTARPVMGRVPVPDTSSSPGTHSRMDRRKYRVPLASTCGPVKPVFVPAAQTPVFMFDMTVQEERPRARDYSRTLEATTHPVIVAQSTHAIFFDMTVQRDRPIYIDIRGTALRATTSPIWPQAPPATAATATPDIMANLVVGEDNPRRRDYSRVLSDSTEPVLSPFVPTATPNVMGDLVIGEDNPRRRDYSRTLESTTHPISPPQAPPPAQTPNFYFQVITPDPRRPDYRATLEATTHPVICLNYQMAATPAEYGYTVQLEDLPRRRDYSRTLEPTTHPILPPTAPAPAATPSFYFDLSVQEDNPRRRDYSLVLAATTSPVAPIFQVTTVATPSVMGDLVISEENPRRRNYSTVLATQPIFPVQFFSVCRPWTPSDISDGSLELWFDASNAPSLVLSGSDVTSWTDLVNGVVTTLAGTVPPTYTASLLNGLPGITCTGNGAFHNTSTGTTYSNFNNDISCLIVGQITTNNYQSVYGAYVTTFGEPTFAFTPGSPAPIAIESVGVADSSSSQTLAQSTPAIMEWVAPAPAGGNWTGVQPYINGTVGGVIPAIPLSGFTQAGIEIFADASGATPGNVHEVVIFNNQVSTTNRQLTEGYLAWKWGLQASLPGGHPYALVPPMVCGAVAPTYFDMAVQRDRPNYIDIRGTALRSTTSPVAPIFRPAAVVAPSVGFDLSLQEDRPRSRDYRIALAATTRPIWPPAIPPIVSVCATWDVGRWDIDTWCEPPSGTTPSVMGDLTLQEDRPRHKDYRTVLASTTRPVGPLFLCKNLVLNPGFETVALSPWVVDGDPITTGGGSGIDTNPAHAHSGNDSAFINTNGASGYVGLRQTVVVAPNTMYTASIWLYSINAQNTTCFTISNAANDTDLADTGPVIPDTAAVPPAATAGYKKYSLSFNSGANIQVNIQVSYTGTVAGSSINVDDASILQVACDPQTPSTTFDMTVQEERPRHPNYRGALASTVRVVGPKLLPTQTPIGMADLSIQEDLPRRRDYSRVLEATTHPVGLIHQPAVVSTLSPQLTVSEDNPRRRNYATALAATTVPVGPQLLPTATPLFGNYATVVTPDPQRRDYSRALESTTHPVGSIVLQALTPVAKPNLVVSEDLPRRRDFRAALSPAVTWTPTIPVNHGVCALWDVGAWDLDNWCDAIAQTPDALATVITPDPRRKDYSRALESTTHPVGQLRGAPAAVAAPPSIGFIGPTPPMPGRRDYSRTLEATTHPRRVDFFTPITVAPSSWFDPPTNWRPREKDYRLPLFSTSRVTGPDLLPNPPPPPPPSEVCVTPLGGGSAPGTTALAPATADAATNFGAATSTSTDFAAASPSAAVPLAPATGPDGQPLPVNTTCP